MIVGSTFPPWKLLSPLLPGVGETPCQWSATN